MSYDSAVLIHIEKQDNVTKERFLQFSNWMNESGFLTFPQGLPAGRPAPTIEYLFYNEDTGEGKEESATINNIDSIEKFISSREIEFISLSIEGGNKELEIEFDSLLAELDNNDTSCLAKAWKFASGA
jgi:hypothetical protein